MISLRAACAGAMPAAMLLALSACGDEQVRAPEAEETEIPEELQTADAPPTMAAEVEGVGTPMDERLATIGLVNKRNNETRDIEMYPGEARRIDDVIIRLSACERTAPWEELQQTGAFVQVIVNERRADDDEARWYGVFSGWLFKESPSLNVVEHPVYDVWLKDCAMSFPGEEAASAPAEASDS